MPVDGIAINLAATAVANVQLQALLPFGKPFGRVGSVRMKAKVGQPKAYVVLQSSGVDFIAVLFQESLDRSVFGSTLIECEPAQPYPAPYPSPRYMQRFSKLCLRVPVLEFRAFAIPQE